MAALRYGPKINPDIEDVERRQRERLARFLKHISTTEHGEVMKLFYEELQSEQFVQDGNLSTALSRAKKRSPEYQRWQKRAVASTRKPMNS